MAEFVACGNPQAVVSFESNDVKVSVKADSNPETIYRDWWRALYGCIDSNVGPYPKPVLTAKDKENDERIKYGNESF